MLPTVLFAAIITKFGMMFHTDHYRRSQC